MPWANAEVWRVAGGEGEEEVEGVESVERTSSRSGCWRL